MGKTINTGVKLDEEAHKRLKSLGAIKDRSPHWLMKDAINRYLDHEEQVESERLLTLERWEQYEETGEAVSHDAVAAWLESLGTEKELPCPAYQKK